MQEARHLRGEEVVVEGVEVDEDAGGGAVEEGAPPPLVVLHGELEVGEADGDAGGDGDEDDEDEEQHRPDRGDAQRPEIVLRFATKTRILRATVQI